MEAVYLCFTSPLHVIFSKEWAQSVSHTTELESEEEDFVCLNVLRADAL